MKNALIRLRENIEHLSQSQQSIANYILSHPDEVRNYTIYRLSEVSYASVSTIVRMCKTLGFEGYKEFHQSLCEELAIQDERFAAPSSDITKEDSFADIIHKITFKNIQSLVETEQIMETNVLKECVEHMLKAKRILLFGLGASHIAARDLYLKLLRVNKDCIINEDSHLQLLSARNSTKEDLAIVISYSGQTKEIISCQEALRENQTPIIAITRPVATPISKLADLELYTTANESLFRSGAISSRISQLNIIDILYTAFANSEYAYSMQQFKKTHIVKE